jgi:type VI protein secretion system component VasF
MRSKSRKRKTIASPAWCVRTFALLIAVAVLLFAVFTLHFWEQEIDKIPSVFFCA